MKKAHLVLAEVAILLSILFLAICCSTIYACKRLNGALLYFIPIVLTLFILSSILCAIFSEKSPVNNFAYGALIVCSIASLILCVMTGFREPNFYVSSSTGYSAKEFYSLDWESCALIVPTISFIIMDFVLGVVAFIAKNPNYENSNQVKKETTDLSSLSEEEKEMLLSQIDSKIEDKVVTQSQKKEVTSSFDDFDL